MEAIKIIFDSMYSIMNISIYLFGFNITLWNAFVFFGICGLASWLFWGLFK